MPHQPTVSSESDINALWQQIKLRKRMAQYHHTVAVTMTRLQADMLANLLRGAVQIGANAKEREVFRTILRQMETP